MLKIMKKASEKANAFLPFAHSEIEETLIAAGALKYDGSQIVSDQPGAIRYGGACWMDSAENPEAGLSTIIKPNTVLAWGKSDKTGSGYNVWDCTNGVTVDEDAGKVYTKVMPILSERLSAELPVFLYGEKVTRIEGGWEVQTSWGVQRAKDGEGYWLYRGHGQINILGIGEAGFEDYWVLSASGDYWMPLSEHEQSLQGGPRRHDLDFSGPAT